MSEIGSEYDPTHSVHDAAHAGDLDSLLRLLNENPARARELGGGGFEPLHFAANAEVAEALIRHGAIANTRDSRGETPLHTAARYGNRDVAESLIRHGANLHDADNRGITALYAAAQSPSPGSREVARLLLDHGAELDLNSALALRMMDRARHFLEEPDAIRKAPEPELLPRLAVWIVSEAIMEAVGKMEYAVMHRLGAWNLDPGSIASVVNENIDILEKVLAQGVPMTRWSFEALVLAVELPHPAVAELLLKTGSGCPAWVDCDYGLLNRRADRSACKEAMRDLLHDYGMDLGAHPYS